MVATLTFVVLTIVEGLQGRQELVKATLRTLIKQEKVTLRGRTYRVILLTISTPMYSSQTDVRGMKLQYILKTDISI